MLNQITSPNKLELCLSDHSDSLCRQSRPQPCQLLPRALHRRLFAVLQLRAARPLHTHQIPQLRSTEHALQITGPPVQLSGQAQSRILKMFPPARTLQLSPESRETIMRHQTWHDPAPHAEVQEMGDQTRQWIQDTSVHHQDLAQGVIHAISLRRQRPQPMALQPLSNKLQYSLPLQLHRPIHLQDVEGHRSPLKQEHGLWGKLSVRAVWAR